VTETPSRTISRERDAVPAATGDAVDLSRMAVLVHQEATLPDTVERVLEFARTAVDCRAAAVVFVHGRHRLELVASTDPAVADLVATQMEAGVGPVLSMVKHDESVVVDDTEEDGPWPAWASAAAGMGYRSFLGVRLETGERTMGTLNLYGDRPDQFSPADVQVAHVLARHGAVALARAQKSDNLWRAVDARKLIGQAEGILMERYDLDQERAFEVLRRYSQDTNVKLRDVAQRVVDTRRLPG